MSRRKDTYVPSDVILVADIGSLTVFRRETDKSTLFTVCNPVAVCHTAPRARLCSQARPCRYCLHNNINNRCNSRCCNQLAFTR
jgi:hypothetical protein